MIRHRFFYLLGALTLLLFASSIVNVLSADGQAGAREWSRVITSVLFTLVLLGAVVAVAERRSSVIVASLLALPGIVMQILEAIASEDHAVRETASSASGALILVYVSVLLLRYLFRSDRVTLDMICASLCLYLLLGLLFAMTYTVIDKYEPGAFGDAQMQFGRPDSVVVYYSYVTLTTLGYGDVTPASPVAQAASVLEAIVGQLYLAVLVARLVGLHIAYATTDRLESD